MREGSGTNSKKQKRRKKVEIIRSQSGSGQAWVYSCRATSTNRGVRREGQTTVRIDKARGAFWAICAITSFYRTVPGARGRTYSCSDKGFETGPLSIPRAA